MKASKRLSFGGKNTPSEIEEINSIEDEIKSLSDEELLGESAKMRERTKGEEDINKMLPRAFAMVREASRRTLGQRHFDVQMQGGIVMHSGDIAEMMTGEGKTLAATAPAYLNALSGDGVHVITVNDYLAKRDAVWMGQIYNALGLSVSCIVHDGAFIYDPKWKAEGADIDDADKKRDETGAFLIQEDFLRPISRKEAYLADITYGTNHEFGFDYLRDNLASSRDGQVQRGFNYAIVDEVDSILIDEARTPLIISVPDTGSSEYYKVFARAVRNLVRDEDYIVDEKLRSVEITEQGIDKVENTTGISDIFSVENLRVVHYLEASLKAKALFERDKDYVVRDSEVVIVDQFTGRLMFGRRYSAGLHQAIEAKEGVVVQDESRTFAQITIQNYFRMYKKLAGMTGTAQTSAEEFHKVYSLEVSSIPPNRPLARDDMPDAVYKSLDAKFRAVAREIKKRHEAGQPVLVGTVSIERNELISAYLEREGVPHEILNAKNNEREGGIIAQAGRKGAVTVATNLAGRGVDIVLGGNPSSPEDAKKVRELGGLHVIGTERHEARRIDNQLRGRAGRQGDPGSSQFFLSLEDDLLRIFGGERLKGFMDRFDLPDDLPIENKMVSKSISQAQSRIEGFNFDARKHLLEYDDVLNKQRMNFYKRRQELLGALDSDPEGVRIFLKDSFERGIDAAFSAVSDDGLPAVLKEAGIPTGSDAPDAAAIKEDARKRISELANIKAVGRQLLGILDFLWMSHLERIEALTESVRIRAYGQRDPLVEYRGESKRMFDELYAHIDSWVFSNLFKIRVSDGGGDDEISAPPRAGVNAAGIGRNDPCPCGAKKPDGTPIKYKKCHGV